jgi:hypothetical protein
MTRYRAGNVHVTFRFGHPTPRTICKGQSESWKGDTEGILVFVCRRTVLVPLTWYEYFQTGLFSATVTVFIIGSYKQLQPNSSDTVILLLAQISHQLAALSSGLPSPSFQDFQVNHHPRVDVSISC